MKDIISATLVKYDKKEKCLMMSDLTEDDDRKVQDYINDCCKSYKKKDGKYYFSIDELNAVILILSNILDHTIERNEACYDLNFYNINLRDELKEYTFSDFDVVDF